MKALLELTERGLVPDSLVRVGARRLIAARLREEYSDDVEKATRRHNALLDKLRSGPVALDTAMANSQHYEVADSFFAHALGPRLKYSACFWPANVETLAEAETAMLELYEERAELEDGMRILDLGCGWGALALWAASRYPHSTVVAISNSTSQRTFINTRASDLGLTNLCVRTADVNELQLNEQFDRILSIEMFEHVRNHSILLDRMAGWLAPDGKLFVHIFCHRYLLYPFESNGDGDWMARHFFTGGLMLARDTLLHFQNRLQIERRWELSGEHYRKTARAWLHNLDANTEAAALALGGSHRDPATRRLLQRWRMFFMACEELFGWRNGGEWLVAHYLFRLG